MICQTILFPVILLTSALTGPPPQPPQHEKSKLSISQTSPTRAFAQAATARCSSARIVNRTIQALRKTNLLVRKGRRSRSEILLICELPRLFQTGNGLRSARIQGAGRTSLVQLQIGPRNFGRHLQYQSRVVIPTRGAVVIPCPPWAHQRSPCLVFL